MKHMVSERAHIPQDWSRNHCIALEKATALLSRGMQEIAFFMKWRISIELQFEESSCYVELPGFVLGEAGR